MKIALISDTHFGARQNAIWMHKYQEKFYKQVFFPYLKQHNITTILHGGDLFDNRKNIDILTLNKTRRMFLDVIDKNKIDMHIIPGNHCVFFKNLNDVSSINEILSHYPTINIIEQPETLEFEQCKITMLPWLNISNYHDSIKYLNRDTSEYLYGHLEIAGFEMHSGIKNEHGMDRKIFKKYKQVWTGHFHQPSTQDNISYLGAPMEFNWGDYDCPRGFSVFDTQTKTMEFIRNPLRLFEKIFYDENEIDIDKFDYNRYNDKFVQVHVVNKTNLKKYERFIDKLYQLETLDLIVYDTSINNQTSFVPSNQTQGQSTQSLISDYIDGIQDDMLDKNEIKKLLNNLYVEAINI